MGLSHRPSYNNREPNRLGLVVDGSKTVRGEVQMKTHRPLDLLNVPLPDHLGGSDGTAQKVSLGYNIS